MRLRPKPYTTALNSTAIQVPYLRCLVCAGDDGAKPVVIGRELRRTWARGGAFELAESQIAP